MPDQRAAGAAAEGLTAGTRIAVKWDHGWEDGLVTAVRIDGRSKLRTYTITYDDGETHDDELRKEADWRYLDAPPSAQLPGGQPGVTRKRRSSGGLPRPLAVAVALPLHPKPTRTPNASPHPHPKPPFLTLTLTRRAQGRGQGRRDGGANPNPNPHPHPTPTPKP